MRREVGSDGFVGELTATAARQHGAPLEPRAETVVHLFWAYGSFSALEKLSALSFLRYGFRVKLWSYGGVGNCPAGVEQCDAGAIIPESRVFTYRNGSYAGFANLFRYAVLCQHGGLWADTDVICLRSASTLEESSSSGFLVTERTKHSVQVNGNVIYHPRPSGGDIIDLALAVTERYPADRMEWGDCGPRLLTALAKTYPKLAPQLMKPSFANPVNWWDCPGQLVTEGVKLASETWFLHCFNEMWRRAGADKNAPYPRNSILGEIAGGYEDGLLQ